MPPLSLERQQQQPIRLNLNDIQCENSEELSEEEQESGMIADRMKSSEEIGKKSNLLKKTTFTLPFIAIREVFLYEGCYGYLLTNGIVGMFIKKYRVNLVL